MSRLTDEEFDDLLKLVTYKTGCQLKRYRHKHFPPTLITIFEDSISQHVLVIRFRNFAINVNQALYDLGKKLNLHCNRILACYFVSEATLWAEDDPKRKELVVGVYGMSRDRRTNLGVVQVKRQRQRILPGRITTLGCAETTHNNLLQSFFVGYEEESTILN